MSITRQQVYNLVNNLARVAEEVGLPSSRLAIEPGDEVDDHLHGLLNKIEDDRAHREAERLRKKAEGMPSYTPPKSGTTGRAVTLMLADEIDPYEMRDGELIRKSDGKPVTI